jgi:hypothetical protein
MFSRKERYFLGLLARSAGRDLEGHRQLAAAFPNPAYRRKLLWGIRRKATTAAADWQLYTSAARVESKVIPGARSSEPPPLAADPLLTLIRGVQSRLAPPRRAVPPRSTLRRPAKRGERRRLIPP